MSIHMEALLDKTEKTQEINPLLGRIHPGDTEQTEIMAIIDGMIGPVEMVRMMAIVHREAVPKNPTNLQRDLVATGHLIE